MRASMKTLLGLFTFNATLGYVQADGRCGWTQTDELRKCIETAR